MAIHDGKYCAEKSLYNSEVIISEKELADCKIPPYVDNTNAPIPELSDGMIPIIWDGAKWVKADIVDKWYDYQKKEWANAVLVSSSSRNTYKNANPGTEILESDVLAYLVWIPRYRYKLFNVSSAAISPQTIEIEFENKETTKSTGSTNGTWLTHPAFTFGTDEINGIWVGKFETTGSSSTPTVKPGIATLSGLNITQQFNAVKNFNNATTYGLNNKFDAHMMKNIEWGATVYLSHSKYGKNGEISTNMTTYSGSATSNAYISNTNQSTTGNIYGIYDMSGGRYERVMAGIFSDANKTKLIIGGSTFTEAQLTLSNQNFIGAKYVDMYDFSKSTTDYNRRKLGDATGETLGWYGDGAVYIARLYPLAFSWWK